MTRARRWLPDRGRDDMTTPTSGCQHGPGHQPTPDLCPNCGTITPTPETPAGGLTEREVDAVAHWVHSAELGHACSMVERIVANRVAAAVVQAHAEDRARIEAARAYVEDPGNWSAFDGRRQHLLGLLNGDRP